MFSPITFTLKMQQVAFEAATAAARMMANNYIQLFDQQSRLLSHSFDYQRGNDHHRTAPPKGPRRRRTPCRGPDLTDHYGKRAHDVDAEHI